MAHYLVEGMTCAACSAHVERAVNKLACVEKAEVSLLSNSMNVQTVDGKDHAAEILQAVAEAGYSARPAGAAAPKATAAPDDPARKLKRRFLGSLIFMIPMMYVSMQHMLGYPIIPLLDAHRYPMVNALAQLLLATPVLLLNRAYFITGFKRLARLSPNMDSLIAVGSGAAYAYGLFMLLRMAVAYGDGNPDAARGFAMELYFESAVMILTLITLGKFFEARAKKKTTAAIEKLMALAPEEAVVEREGQLVRVPVAQVRVGDILVIRPGERVAVDGVLLEGAAALDQSHITGESVPVDKRAGDAIIAGSMNPSGLLRMRATTVGEDTTLSRIVRLVQEAGDSKAPISKLADRVSAVFVPVVMGIALATLIVWLAVGQTFSFALSCAIAVLVISCPCALGLATPVAIMVGTGVGAQHGILLRNGEVLETLHHIKSIVLDKTGTITQGRMTVQSVHPAADVSEEALLRLASSLEKGSEHPLAAAVMAYCAQRGVQPEPVEGFEALAGRGIKAVYRGQAALAGNERWMLENGVDTGAARRALNSAAEKGASVMCFSLGGRLWGVAAVADTLKPSSPAAVQMLKDLGVTPCLLTGDQKAAALSIARQVGIEEVLAEVMPADKAARVRQLQAGGRRVAMVGDGINDAPALKQADVGIALGAGTDIAIETADVVLVSNRLTDVACAVRLSRSVIRNIKENLFWAFFYNTVGIPIAAGLLYPAFGLTLNPMLGAAAMSLSSVCVVTNALRLRRFRVDPVPEDPVTPRSKEESPMKRIMHIQGMSCNHCKMSVEKALKALPGVSAAEVDLAQKIAVVTGDALDAQAMTDAVTEAGFEVESVD